ncbi:MAG: hypothetical protein BWY66_02960 [bacterium ADurb.Bin374]|nr:MAG: hypothetical protein BWY66_02960 [bacterium ADurb.Bin374]
MRPIGIEAKTQFITVIWRMTTVKSAAAPNRPRNDAMAAASPKWAVTEAEKR